MITNYYYLIAMRECTTWIKIAQSFASHVCKKSEIDKKCIN